MKISRLIDDFQSEADASLLSALCTELWKYEKGDKSMLRVFFLFCFLLYEFLIRGLLLVFLLKKPLGCTHTPYTPTGGI
jgi:hypothetical protein